MLAQSGHIGTARRAVAADNGHLGDTLFRKDALVAEYPPTRRENPRHFLEIAARAVADMYHWQLIFQRKFERAHDFRHGHGVPSAALVGTVVGVNDDLAPGDHTDAGDDVGTRCLTVVKIVRRQTRKL